MAVTVEAVLDGKPYKGKSPSYPLGHTVTIVGQFKVDGTLTNPGAATITVRDPDGTQTTPSVTSTSTGIRTAVYVTALVGWHRVKIEGTTTAAGVETAAFYVHSTGLT